jgi:hypothetical protein
LRRLNIQKMRSAESAEKIARLPLRKNGESKGSTIVALFHFTITLKHYFNPTLQASRLLDQRCLLMPCYRLNMRRWERRETQSPSPLKNTGQVSSLGRRNKRQDEGNWTFLKKGERTYETENVSTLSERRVQDSRERDVHSSDNI